MVFTSQKTRDDNAYARRRPAARPRFLLYTEIAIGPDFSQSRVTFYVWRIGCIGLWLAEIWPDGNFCIQKKLRPGHARTYVAGLRKLIPIARPDWKALLFQRRAPVKLHNLKTSTPKKVYKIASPPSLFCSPPHLLGPSRPARPNVWHHTLRQV